MITATQKGHPLLADSSFEPLKDYVIATTGLSYYCNRSSELADHVTGRLQTLGISNCSSYCQLLESGRAGNRELDHLIEVLTIGETHFFRHLDLFVALEKTIFPELIEKNKKHRRLRIWSAGSSIGAEAYTLSILLRRHLAHQIRDWEISIIGTDINRSFLSRAANAQFEDWALRGVTEEIKQQCFSRDGKLWTLHPEFKKGVYFQYHNLADHPFPSMLHNLFAFDLILCRNVTIYFSQPIIERIIGNMRRCLVDGGWLLVGHAEHRLALFRDFRTANFDGAIAYQRVDGLNGTTGSLSRRTPACAEPPESPQPALTLSPTPKAQKSPQPPVKTNSQPIGQTPSALVDVRILADSGEIERANAQCHQLLKTHKLSPTCHLYHALILEQLGQHSASQQALRRAIYLDRSFVLAHYYLGLSLQRSGRQADAARSLQNVRQLLATMNRESEIDNSDGLTVAELDDLTRMQLDAIVS